MARQRFHYLLCILAFPLLMAGCGKTINLQTGLSENDANEIVTVLDEAGIKAEKVPQKDGIAVTVDEKEMPKANSVLQMRGLPRRQMARLGDVFKKEGMISTPLEERARYIYALSQELEYTLSQIDGVVFARVHVVLPERVAPGEAVQPSSAAVMIKYREPLEPDVLTTRVRQLVASSIPGLAQAAKDKISVVFVPSTATVEAVRWTQVGPFRVQEGSAGALAITMAVGAVVILLLLLTIGGYFLLKVDSVREKVDSFLNRSAESA